MPKTIFLFRHAEKPSGDEGIHLSPKGFARARALPIFFSKYDQRHQINKLIAQGPKNKKSSLRPIETLVPTSETINRPIDRNFVKGQASELVAAIIKDTSINEKAIVVCWGHDELAEIAYRLGYKNAKEWSSKTFDRMWVLQFNSAGRLVRFIDLPQRLLPGDSPQ